MILKRLGLAGLIAGLGLAASACTDNYGYGYGGASVGYASDYYGSAYGPGFGPGYTSAGYFGWYDDFYYPGTGVFVYDRYRRPFRWNAAQQRYWQGRGSAVRGNRAQLRDNWQAFRQDRRGDVRAFRQDRRADVQAYRNGQVTRQQFRAERQSDRQEFRTERRADRQQFRQQAAQPRANAGQVRQARESVGRLFGGNRGNRRR